MREVSYSPAVPQNVDMKNKFLKYVVENNIEGEFDLIGIEELENEEFRFNNNKIELKRDDESFDRALLAEMENVGFDVHISMHYVEGKKVMLIFSNKPNYRDVLQILFV